MLNFHWMHRSQDSDFKFIESFSKVLDDAGYYSVLHVYDPLNSDYFVKVARAMTLGQKLKHMFAIRTYAVSPEFLSMICKSFDEIETNRIMLNIVSGDKYQMLNETEVDGVIGVDISESNSRISHTEKFMNKFVNLNLFKSLKSKLEMVMSGSSEHTLKLAKEYGDYNLAMIDQYLEDPLRYLNEKIIVGFAIIVVETHGEKIFYEKLVEDSVAAHWTIIGTDYEIKEKLNSFELMGITDVLLALHQFDRAPDRIHQLVSDINKGIL